VSFVKKIEKMLCVLLGGDVGWRSCHHVGVVVVIDTSHFVVVNVLFFVYNKSKKIFRSRGSLSHPGEHVV